MEVAAECPPGDQEACPGPGCRTGLRGMVAGWPCSSRGIFLLAVSPGERAGLQVPGVPAFPGTSVQGLCPLLSGSFPLYLAFFSHVVVKLFYLSKRKDRKKQKQKSLRATRSILASLSRVTVGRRQARNPDGRAWGPRPPRLSCGPTASPHTETRSSKGGGDSPSRCLLPGRSVPGTTTGVVW